MPALPRLAPSLLALVAMALSATAAAVPQVPLGQRDTLRDLVLPGPELVAKPLEPGSPVVLRVLETRPHGDAFRYDLEFYGLEAGPHDLADYLVRADGGERGEPLSVPVDFTAVLPAERILPNDPATAELPRVGGYRTALVAAGALWVAVLLLLIFYRRRNTTADAHATPGPPLTAADRLRPLVAAARDGELDEEGKAELERTLLTFWRERLDLASESPATALAKLRAHPEGGALLAQVERWLHAPEQPDPAVGLDALLAPYAIAQPCSPTPSSSSP